MGKSILPFCILTFFLSWIVWIPMIIIGDDILLCRVAGSFGPIAAALGITGMRDGTKGIVKLFQPFLFWKVDIFWYLFSFFSTALLTLSAIGIYIFATGNELTFNDPKSIYLVIPVFLYVLLFSVLGEETGWRGFALPGLQDRYGAVKASLIIGCIWGFWHLPLFFVEGNFHQDIPLWLFILQDIALSVVMSWIYNHTGGSLLLIHLFHASSNTTLGILPVLPMDTGGDLMPLYISCGLLLVLSMGIIVTGNLGKPIDYVKE